MACGTGEERRKNATNNNTDQRDNMTTATTKMANSGSASSPATTVVDASKQASSLSPPPATTTTTGLSQNDQLKQYREMRQQERQRKESSSSSSNMPTLGSIPFRPKMMILIALVTGLFFWFAPSLSTHFLLSMSENTNELRFIEGGAQWGKHNENDVHGVAPAIVISNLLLPGNAPSRQQDRFGILSALFYAIFNKLSSGTSVEYWRKQIKSLCRQAFEMEEDSGLIKVKKAFRKNIRHGTMSGHFGSIGIDWDSNRAKSALNAALESQGIGHSSYARWEIRLAEHHLFHTESLSPFQSPSTATSSDYDPWEAVARDIRRTLDGSFLRQRLVLALEAYADNRVSARTNSAFHRTTNPKKMNLLSFQSHVTVYESHGDHFFLNSVSGDGPTWQDRLSQNHGKQTWTLLFYLGNDNDDEIKSSVVGVMDKKTRDDGTDTDSADDGNDANGLPKLCFGCPPGDFDYEAAKAQNMYIPYRYKVINGFCESLVLKPNMAVLFPVTPDTKTKPKFELSFRPEEIPHDIDSFLKHTARQQLRRETTTKTGNKEQAVRTKRKYDLLAEEEELARQKEKRVRHFFVEAIYVENGGPEGMLYI